MEKKLYKILKKFFKKKKFFNDNDSPETINEWDSLNHLNLIKSYGFTRKKLNYE